MIEELGDSDEDVDKELFEIDSQLNGQNPV